uniref:NADH dehydrogenase subunit 2 n=1 Tax=Chloroidium sp. UTEX 3077 TaxID=2686440 RepID=A0A6B9F3E6_9CHLO|nr:NADH dehydrogenase subunit 2 [Chloroidium sp. UTEX 3077]
MLYNFRDEFQSAFGTQFQSFLFENDFKAVIPESFLVLASLILLVYGVVYSGSKKSGYPIIMHGLGWLVQLSLLFTFLLLVNNPLCNGSLFYNSLVIDSFTLFFKGLVCVGALVSVLISLSYVEQENINAFELLILVLLSTASMLFLVSAVDFICMYLAIELQSLCFYVMAGLKRNSEFSTEAGLKYFLLGAFSSGILLFGCSLLYGFTGTTNFLELGKIFTCGSEELLAGISSVRACELGMVFVFVGFLFKLSAVPFHMWAPDVYEGAPTSVTAFFSIVPKVSVLAVFIRLSYEGFYDLMIPWQQLILFSSIASMILGSLAALSQNKVKRLLAFSSIGHVGYILIGFCCGTVEGIQALVLYLFVYIIMTMNLFALILSPLRRERLSCNDSSSSGTGSTRIERIKYTTDLAMLAKTNPILASTLTVTMFSIAGIPPLAGFYSKAFLMFAAMSSAQYLLAIVGVLTSVVTCFYYIRIVKIMYFETPSKWLTFMQVPKENSLLLGCTLAFLLFFCIYPTPLFIVTHKVALSLCF